MVFQLILLSIRHMIGSMPDVVITENRANDVFFCMICMLIQLWDLIAFIPDY